MTDDAQEPKRAMSKDEIDDLFNSEDPAAAVDGEEGAEGEAVRAAGEPVVYGGEENPSGRPGVGVAGIVLNQPGGAVGVVADINLGIRAAAAAVIYARYAVPGGGIDHVVAGEVERDGVAREACQRRHRIVAAAVL